MVLYSVMLNDRSLLTEWIGMKDGDAVKRNRSQIRSQTDRSAVSCVLCVLLAAVCSAVCCVLLLQYSVFGVWCLVCAVRSEQVGSGKVGL